TLFQSGMSLNPQIDECVLKVDNLRSTDKVNEPSLPIKRTYPGGVSSNDLIQLEHVNVIDSSINVIMISIMKSPEDVSAMSFSPSDVKLTQLKWWILVCERTGKIQIRISILLISNACSQNQSQKPISVGLISKFPSFGSEVESDIQECLGSSQLSNILLPNGSNQYQFGGFGRLK
ncbi:MAG: hypothetical protein EZS28_023152, partial [Streblomastix strix]